MLKIPFKKKQIIVPFLIGIILLGVGLTSMILRTKFYLSGFAGLGLFWIGTGISRKIYPYIQIDSEMIKLRNDFFAKKMILTDITEINKFAGDLIVKSAKKEIYISRSLIEDSGLEQIEKTLTEKG